MNFPLRSSRSDAIATIRAACAGLAIALAAACSESQNLPPGVTVDTLPSGRMVVENTGRSTWTEDGGWRLEEVLRIGSLDGAGPESFGAVDVLTVDVHDRVWVYDHLAAELRVFDANGMFVRTIGRRGDGPGEFDTAVGLLWDPSERLWTVDQRAARLTVFDTAGTFLESHPWTGSAFFFRWPGTIDREGHFLDIQMDWEKGGMVLVRLDPALQPLDTLDLPEVPDGADMYMRTVDGRSAATGIPFAPSVEWALTPEGGMWAVVTDEYQLARLDPHGDTVLLSRLPFEPRPLAGIERAEMQLPFVFGEPIPRDVLPAFKPVISRLLLDELGHVWIIRATDEDEGQVVDIFDPEGIYRGTLLAPVRLDQGPVAFRDGYLVTTVRGEFDEQYVVRYRVDRR